MSSTELSEKNTKLSIGFIITLAHEVIETLHIHISVFLQADETHSTQTYQITDSHEQ